MSLALIGCDDPLVHKNTICLYGFVFIEIGIPYGYGLSQLLNEDGKPVKCSDALKEDIR